MLRSPLSWQRRMPRSCKASWEWCTGKPRLVGLVTRSFRCLLFLVQIDREREVVITVFKINKRYFIKIVGACWGKGNEAV